MTIKEALKKLFKSKGGDPASIKGQGIADIIDAMAGPDGGSSGGSGGGIFITCEMSGTNNNYPFIITNMDKVCDALDAIRENPATASQYAVLVNSTIGGDFPSTLYTFKPYFYANGESGNHIRVSCFSSLNPEAGYGTSFVEGGEWIVTGQGLRHYNMRVAGDWWFNRDALDENGTLTAYTE